jgi:2-dehydropantoate 2-reductase
LQVIVVGAGALGCLVAALMHRGGVSVTLVDYKPARAARIRKQGIIIEQPGGETLTVPVSCTAKPARLAPPELAVICVKAYDTRDAAMHIAPVVGEGTTVLTIQNGMGNIELLEGIFPGKVMGGVTSCASTLLGPGRVRKASLGQTYIGWPKGEGDKARLDAVAALFASCGSETHAVDNIRTWVWHKLILNAGLNALGAILHLPNGRLIETGPVRDLISEVVREAVAVARLNGVLLPVQDYNAEVEKLAKATSANLCTMLQDVLRGRRTEIGAINGVIAEEAERLGMEACVNQTLVWLVRAMEVSYPSRVGKAQ